MSIGLEAPFFADGWEFYRPKHNANGETHGIEL